jgi:hypothetical protein
MLREFNLKGAAEALRFQRRQKGGQIGIGRRQILVNYLSPREKHGFPLWILPEPRRVQGFALFEPLRVQGFALFKARRLQDFALPEIRL